MDERSDEALTTALRDGGDTAATEELYRRHAPAVLAYARTCCRDPHTAEDLASEAFARTVQAVREGHGPVAAWRPYLLAVVRNTAARWAERARRVDLAPDFGEWAATATAHRSPGPDQMSGEERAVRAEDEGMMAAAFRALPERWQAVLWHHVVEEEPTAAVGTLLGLSSSGVASLTARAREGLREAYLAAHARQGAADEECRRCGDRLAAAVRRSRPRRDAHLDRHLERCERCRRAARELTDLNQRLRTVLPGAVLLFGGPAYLEARAAGATAVPATGTAAAESAGAAGAAGAKAAVLAAGAAAALLAGWALWPGGEDAPGRTAPLTDGVSSSAATHDVRASETRPAPTATLTPTATPTPSRSPSGPPPSPSPSASAPPPGPDALGGTSTLRFVSTGTCMEVPGGSAQAGVRPVEASCDGGARQRWTLLEPFPGDRSRLQVRNEATGLCLTRSGGTQDHAPVDQRACDAASGTQLWNLWADSAQGQVALRDAGGSRHLGLVEWARADQEQEHGTAIGTTRYYYGSASRRFRYEPGLLGE
ncbi:sigma-70 family RNA polymerase sigma factor [Streptomyces sp. CRN 30]|uniref:sigma-70 family RNA polymerase sigma factor n=1 Tax=Streptomyces sp. CRN 30 TaxID=3075613 RepID=UPI002A83C17D|nr:sigma-70 family RNA polymerase sigma factor [Streptomyces sp. CRN 30]